MLKQLAEVINTSTGRGNIGKLENFMPALSAALFAPRLIASRVQMLNPQYYIKLKGPARKEALRQALGMGAFFTGIMSLAALAGAEVGTDPRSSNFGKIKVGDTRFDITGGYAQYVKLATQIATGQVVSSTNQKVTELGQGINKSRKDVLLQFLEGKANPPVSFVTTMLKGKDVSGNDIWNLKGVSKEVLDRFIPLVVQDTADLFTHPESVGGKLGPAGYLGAVAGAMGGIGVQTYGEQDLPLSDKQKALQEYQKRTGTDKETLKARKAFYQKLKSAPDKQETSDKINDALAAGDTSEARRIAREYNKKLKEHMAEWKAKYPGMSKDKELVKEYNAKKMPLTSTQIKQRLRRIKEDPERKLANL